MAIAAPAKNAAAANPRTATEGRLLSTASRLNVFHSSKQNSETDNDGSTTTNETGDRPQRKSVLNYRSG